MTTFIPSPEQQAIIDAFVNGTDNLGVDALAGTGKTATIVELAKHVKERGIYVAHNKSIATDVEPKLAGTMVQSKTLHSVGNGALMKVIPGAKVDGDKYRTLARIWSFPSNNEARPELQTAVMEMLELLSADEKADFPKEFLKEFPKTVALVADWIRYKLIDPDDTQAIAGLIIRYMLDEDLVMICPDDSYTPLLIAAAQWCVNEGERLAREEKKIDFTDMVYLPVKWNLNIFAYKYVFIDEAQDLSPMQRALADKLIWKERGGRVVVVGDPRQAIYAFSGADADSFDLSMKMWNCKIFPLTVTRRCGQIIVHHANTLVPEYQALDTNPRGKIVWWKQDKLHEVAQPGDMVICRLKAPLVGTMFDLVAANKPVTLLGVDVAKIVERMIERLEKREGFAWETFEAHLEKYTWEQVNKFQKKGNESAAQDAFDTQDMIVMLIEKANATSLDGFKMFVDRFFASEGTKNKITLCTAHKSKGLEADRIFLLNPDKLPLRHPKLTPAQAQQETNLYYVAMTRAKHTLVYLTNDAYPKDRPMPTYVQLDFADREWQVVLPQPEALPAPAELPQLPAPVDDVEEAVIVEEPALNYDDAPKSNLHMLTEPDIIFTDEDFGDDDEDAPMLTFASGQPVPEVEGLTWNMAVAGQLPPAPSSPEHPLNKLKVASLDDEPTAPMVASVPEPITIPMPPFRVSRDHQADIRREKADKVLTAARQSLVDVVMTLDLKEIAALMEVLQQVKTLKTPALMPSNVVEFNGATLQ